MPLFESVVTGSAVAGTVAVVNVASGAVISALGFTAGGVGAGTVAAGIQSGIGLVAAGSKFAALQSIGALGGTILGGAVLPVADGLGAVVGVAKFFI